MSDPSAPAALLTGGAGAFGRQVATALVDSGWTVAVLDRAPPPAWAADLGVTYHRGDVCDPDLARRAVTGAGAVVHAAFAPPESTLEVVRRVNVEGTRTVLTAAREAGCPRAVVVSSTIVTRPLRRHPLLAKAALSRLVAYRQSRVAAEEAAARAAEAGLAVAVARPRTFVAPGGVSAFAVLFELLRRGRAVPVLGRGENRCQLVDGRDLARGLSLLAGSELEGCLSFGAERFGTVNDDLGALIRHAGSSARLVHVPPLLARAGVRSLELLGASPLAEWHHASARGEDVIADISRAVAELGWRPRRSNAEALADAYDWYAGRHASGAPPLPTHPVPLAHRALQLVADRLLPGPR